MSKDYKDTLLMMKTAFSMRANLTEKEPQIQKHWEEKDVYRKVLEKNQGHPSL
jgi:isoleucyl-tRNA synthetase